MNQTTIPPTALLLSAAMGWMFYIRGRHAVGNAMLAMSIMGLWSLAVFNQAAPHSRVIAPTYRSPSRIYASELKIDGQSVIVSTLDRSKRVYHEPDCSYVRLMKVNAQAENHMRTFRSKADAEAAGFSPCSRCVKRPAIAATN